MEKALPNDSVNKHIFIIIKDFFRFSTKAEIRFDILFSLFLSFIFFGLLALIEPSNKSLLSTIDKINGTALAVIAILAGFNITSLSIIAASNKEALTKIVKLGKDKTKNNVLKQIITFFSYSILIQLIILVIGTILVIIINSAQGLHSTFDFLNWVTIRVFLFISGFIWVSAILYSLFISIRNVALLYRYVIYVGMDTITEKEQ